MTHIIPVSDITLAGREAEYVADVVASRQWSWHGYYVQKFEEAFAVSVDRKYAVSCSSGTAALHLALVASGVGPGVRVGVPALTYVATANAVRYTGAQVVLGDVDSQQWGLAARVAEINLPVYLYGHRPPISGDVVDAAEALGTPVFGTLACYSFYANKVISTGEGGMVVTDDGGLAERIRHLRGQAARGYYHDELGFNYRMTNLQAALGLAQLDGLSAVLERRRGVVDAYRASLEFERQESRLSAPWMFACLLPPAVRVDRVRTRMAELGVETRPMFTPLHRLPMYRTSQVFPVAEDIAERGICLPTHANLTPQDVRTVVDALHAALR